MSPGNFLSVEVDVVEALGAELCGYFKIGDQALTAKMPSKLNIKPKQQLEIALDTDKLYLFDKAGNRIRYSV